MAAQQHRPTLFQRLFRRAATPQAQDDAADLGTAFGLDYVLDQQPAPASLPARPEGQAPLPWPLR